MTKKEKIVFALYVTVTVATITHTGVELYKTFKDARHDAKLRKEALKDK